MAVVVDTVYCPLPYRPRPARTPGAEVFEDTLHRGAALGRVEVQRFDHGLLAQLVAELVEGGSLEDRGEALPRLDRRRVRERESQPGRDPLDEALAGLDPHHIGVEGVGRTSYVEALEVDDVGGHCGLLGGGQQEAICGLHAAQRRESLRPSCLMFTPGESSWVAMTRQVRLLKGIVRLTLRPAQCRDEHSPAPLPSASLSARNHQPCRLALPQILPELPGC